MARPLISARTVRTIDNLRIRGWETSYATADPQVSVVISRADNTTGVITVLDEQRVVIKWLRQESHGQQEGGAQESSTRFEMRRPVALEFDVEPEDRFAIQDKTAIVSKVHENNGMIVATCEMAFA